ncbi:MAG: transporter substrate-binding domain-containing protein [Undibacterium sp.]|nr:transporter substrate-binding domain-containing protein [Undibacterium sp.]
MKSARHNTLHLLLVLMLMGFAMFNLGLAQTTLRIGTPNDKRPSIVAAQRVLQVAYARLHIQVEFINAPPKRVDADFKNGVIDGMSYRYSAAPDPLVVLIQTPITYDDLVVFSAGTNLKVEGFPSLRPYTVGYIRGTNFLETQLIGISTETAPTSESMLRKLVAGRTNLAVDARSSLCVAQQLGLKKIYVIEPALAHLPGYFVLQKKHQAQAQPLENILKKMEKEGEIQKILTLATKEFMAKCGV